MFAMGFIIKVLKRSRSTLSTEKFHGRYFHGKPFVDFYEKITGIRFSPDKYSEFKKKHPNIDSLSYEDLKWTLKVLDKFGISPLEACKHPHLFSMSPITVDNNGEILIECGFVKILPKHIVKYHTLVKSRTIAQLKKENLIREDMNLEQHLQDCFTAWPNKYKTIENFSESNTSLLTVRMSVLEKFLIWKMSITSEEFQNYCRNYLPIKHKPMSDIEEALDIAENNIKFGIEEIRRNGFIISSDPMHTKLILENVPTLAGLDIRDIIRLEPAILKNNFKALLKIRNLLEEYRIPVESQRRYLRVYCMRPETVQKNLDELMNTKEYQILSSNPRVLWMVVHKRKMISRLMKIQTAKKQCYSLNHLVASTKVFNNYITSFGDKVCGRDMATLIATSLNVNAASKSALLKTITTQLKRHNYYLHSSLNIIDETIQFLKKKFDDRSLLNHCQLLLYPTSEIEQYLDMVLEMREKGYDRNQIPLDGNYNNLNCAALTDDHILSLVLYEIEKKYHFSGDGIWVRQGGVILNSNISN